MSNVWPIRTPLTSKKNYWTITLALNKNDNQYQVYCPRTVIDFTSLFKECEVYKRSRNFLGYVNIVSCLHQFWSWLSIIMIKRQLSAIGVFPGTSESSSWINQIYCIIWYEAVTLLIHINKNGTDKFIIDVKVNSLHILDSESFRS